MDDLVEIEQFDAVNLIDELTAEVERLKWQNQDLQEQLNFVRQNYTKLLEKLQHAAEVIGDRDSEVSPDRQVEEVAIGETEE